MKQIRIILILFIVFFPKTVIPSTTNQPLDKGVFLVATRDLTGTFFAESVILVAEYSHKGTLGVIINFPTDISLAKTLPNFKGLDKSSTTLFIGGPVSRYLPFMLMRANKKTKGVHHIFNNLFYSSKIQAIVYNILNKDSKSNIRVYAGFSSWAPGQLEEEVAQGRWRVIKADEYTVFEKKSESIWEELIEKETQLFVENIDKNLIRISHKSND